MDEAVHVVLGDSLGDALSTVNVYIGVGEVPDLQSIDYSRSRIIDICTHLVGYWRPVRL